MTLTANEGKNEIIEASGNMYARYPIKTPVITKESSLIDIVMECVLPNAVDGDIIFMSEKAVACSQNRAVLLTDIKPRKLAVFLSKYVYKSPHGIGLSMPETMEMALRECGVIRILFAAFVSMIGKLFGRRGWFYVVAGEKASSIDGPTPNTLPPYNKCVVLGPNDPAKVSKEIALETGFKTCVVDINDLGGKILGVSDDSMDKELLVMILKDNPLGQDGQQTPMGLIRKIS